MNKESKQLISELLTYAETGEHSSFAYIRNWPDYIALKKSRRTLRSVIKILESSHRNTFNNYCKLIPCGSALFIKLLACNAVKDALAFYRQEYQTQTDMIDEYEMYLLHGNLLKSFLYEQRPDHELWDHRGI